MEIKKISKEQAIMMLETIVGKNMDQKIYVTPTLTKWKSMGLIDNTLQEEAEDIMVNYINKSQCTPEYCMSIDKMKIVKKAFEELKKEKEREI